VISNLLVRVGVDDSRVRRGIDRAARQMNRLGAVGDRLAGRMANAGSAAGRNFGDGFWRDANGRLRDSMDRFVVEAEDGGRRVGSGFTSGALSGIVRLTKGMGRLAATAGRLAAPLGAAAGGVMVLSSAVAAATPQVVAVAKAAISAGPALVALGAAGHIVRFALTKIFEEGSKARAALQPLGDAINEAAKAGSNAAARGIEPLANALRRAAYPTVERFFVRVGAAANVAQRNFLNWAKSAAGLRAIRGILDPIGESLGRLAPQVSRVAIEFVAMLGRIMGVSTAAGERGLSKVLDLVAERLRRISAADVQSGIRRLAETFNKIKSVVSTAVRVVGKLVNAYKTYQKEFWYIADALAVVAIAFGGPVTAVIAGVGLLVRHFDRVKDAVANIRAAFKSPIATNFMNNLRTAAGNVLPALKSGFDKIRTAALPVLQEIWNKVKNQLIPALGEFIAAVSPVVGWFLRVLGPTVANTFKNVLTIISGAISMISGILKVFTGILTGDWSKAWEGVKLILKGAWTIIKALVNQSINQVLGILRGVLGVIRAVWNGAWNAVKAAAKAVWNGIVSLVRGALNGVKSAVTSGINAARNAIQSGWNKAKSLTSSAWNSMRSATSNGISKLVSLARGIPGKIKKAVGSLGSLLYGAGRNVIQGLINGIRSMIGRVGGAMSDVTRTIRRFLPFSPAKEGPLSGRGSPDIAGAKIAQMVADGMLSGVRPVSRAASGVASAASLNARGAYSVAGTRTAARGGAATVIELRSGGSRMDDLLVEVLRRAIQARGGNVQAVLGQRGR